MREIATAKFYNKMNEQKWLGGQWSAFIRSLSENEFSGKERGVNLVVTRQTNCWRCISFVRFVKALAAKGK